MSFGMTRPSARNLAGLSDKDIAHKTAELIMWIFAPSKKYAVEKSNGMFSAERMSITGLEGAKGQSISRRVVKEGINSGIAENHTHHRKERCSCFIPAGRRFTVRRNHSQEVSSDKCLAVRAEHLAKEKEFTRLRDQLSQQRRDLPWERVNKEYVFEGPNGKETLSELFAGKSQLIVYHFMFDPAWEAG
jgi:Bacterial protein of unknown function (DUF899)